MSWKEVSEEMEKIEKIVGEMEEGDPGAWREVRGHGTAARGRRREVQGRDRGGRCRGHGTSAPRFPDGREVRGQGEGAQGIGRETQGQGRQAQGKEREALWRGGMRRGRGGKRRGGERGTDQGEVGVGNLEG